MPLYLVAEAVSTAPGMSAGDATSVSNAFTTAGSNLMGQFVQFLPVLLGLAVVGFAIGMVYKAIRKVRKGAK